MRVIQSTYENDFVEMAKLSLEDPVPAREEESPLPVVKNGTHQIVVNGKLLWPVYLLNEQMFCNMHFFVIFILTDWFIITSSELCF